MVNTNIEDIVSRKKGGDIITWQSLGSKERFPVEEPIWNATERGRWAWEY